MKILFIDDDNFYTQLYKECLIEELEPPFTIETYERVTMGLNAVAATEEIALIILDIMMPTPLDVDAGATCDGLSTGIWFLTQVRERLIKRNIKILVLSNRGMASIRDELKDISFPDGLVEVHHKVGIRAVDLPRKVKKFLERPIKPL